MSSEYPRLSKPSIVGYMSVDVVRNYLADLSELKYITHIPNGRISFDLNHNMNNAIKRTTEDNDEKIDLLLKFCLDQSSNLDDYPHFVSHRSDLINVLTSGSFDPRRIVATLFHGSIYLHTIDDESRSRKVLPADQLKFKAWGYKFEQYMNADLPSQMPVIQKPVAENAEFYVYLKASLGKHNLLYAAQIDGLLATDGSVPDPPQNADYETNLNYLRNNNRYVELKTNRIITHPRQDENFKRRKLLHCWGQCYLANLRGLLVGFRNDSGIVQQLRWFDTEEIVSYCQGVWHPGKALQFLDYFLTFVKDAFRNVVRKTIGENVNFKNIDPITLQFDINTDSSIKVTEECEYIILRDWFVEARKTSKV